MVPTICAAYWTLAESNPAPRRTRGSRHAIAEQAGTRPV